MAVGLVSGRVQAFRAAQGAARASLEEVVSKKVHKESCRAVRFTQDGATLLTASADM